MSRGNFISFRRTSEFDMEKSYIIDNIEDKITRI